MGFPVIFKGGDKYFPNLYSDYPKPRFSDPIDPSTSVRSGTSKYENSKHTGSHPHQEVEGIQAVYRSGSAVGGGGGVCEGWIYQGKWLS